MSRQSTVDVLTFNLNNPSRERAERQLAYLAARPEHVLVLTETADSAGCDLLEARFSEAGYSVTFPRPGRGERGVMVVSRLETRPLECGIEYLPHRAVGVAVDTTAGPLDVIGLYVPSRDATEVKKERKRRFLEEARYALPSGLGAARVILGDLNVLEPAHLPRYKFFQEFEYGFYDWFAEAGYADAFRARQWAAAEYSWVGRTGDGYRYDHAFVSLPLVERLLGCEYVHEPRTSEDRLTDHSALTVHLAVTATTPRLVTDPTRAEESAAALF
ncbi:endonuclease/exonuclease/phosphatase family protein [Streptomyces sp. NPDC001552]|uniref:endonuclease/exonuclease/phosphatase family protein n=1 Tax=Streptomyces sp. NPDC001552 TaxID=3364587 RepID=UPI003694F999